MRGLRSESHPWDLNPKPTTYEAVALPIELGWHERYYTSIGTGWQILSVQVRPLRCGP